MLAQREVQEGGDEDNSSKTYLDVKKSMCDIRIIDVYESPSPCIKIMCTHGS